MSKEKFYKDHYGVVNIVVEQTIKHEDGDYTFLVGRTPDYTWIRTADLYNTHEEAQDAPPAIFG